MTVPWNKQIWKRLTHNSDSNVHAWLFSGPEGLGKLELALNFSSHLLGDSSRFNAASHPDFHVLTPEDQTNSEGILIERYGMRYYATKKGLKPKSVISVDQVRALTGALMTYGHGSHKVVLIHPAHQMNINASNALLKVLEEPPSGTTFILVSNRPNLLPATVRSRCSTIHFRVPPREQALAWLSEQIVDQTRLPLVLSLAGGAPILAMQYKESGFLDTRDEVVRDVQTVIEKPVDVSAISTKWKSIGIHQTLGILRSVLVDLVRIGFQPKTSHLFNPDQVDWLQGVANVLHLRRVFSMVDRISAYLQDVNAPLDQNLVLEDFLLELNNIAEK
ncbi:MAG: DNA polymerase III subunit delta' C-terminal domain-containing protein [Arenicellales bacterium]|nr:DNA polymerase III subunit delta' C-terminal domain-containing protein [Arenicellales bacterium]